MRPEKKPHQLRGAWVIYSRTHQGGAASCGRLLEFWTADDAVAQCLDWNTAQPGADWTVQRVYGRELDRLRAKARRGQRS